MARSNLLTGAQVLVSINNRRFGRVQALSWESKTPRKKVRCIDLLTPWGLLPMAVELSGHITIYRLHKDGGIEAAGMIATWNDMTREKYFNILVTDRVTDTVIFHANKCSVESQSWNYGRGYVMGSISFSGIHWNNETEPGLGQKQS